MRALGRGGALPLAGFAAFLLFWQGVVIATRPDPYRRVTMGFSAPRGQKTVAVVVRERGEVIARATLGLDPGSGEASAAELRAWFGSLQPTLAALPPARPPAEAAGGEGAGVSGAAGAAAGTPRGRPEGTRAPAGGADPLRRLVEGAKLDFGGGLEISEVPLPDAPDDPASEAVERATRLQLAHIVQPAWIPGPSDAATAAADMIRSGEMIRHVVASLFRVATGFAIAVALGIPFGLGLGSFAWLNSLTNSVIQCLRPISPIAWLPVVTLAVGGGDIAAIVLIFLASFFPIAVSTAAAVATVDLKYRRSAANFGVWGIAAARQVILPAALPAILTALRIALGISWVVVVAAEMLGVESGLGYLVLDARNQLRYDRVVAGMVVIGLIGLLIDSVIRRFERAELGRRGLGG